MFRVDRAIQDDGVHLSITGELRSESVETVESACLKACAEHAQVTVIVNNVTEFDADGFALLRRLIIAGVQVRATGINSQYILKKAELLSVPRQSDI